MVSPPPDGSKNDVFKFRSVIWIIIAVTKMVMIVIIKSSKKYKKRDRLNFNIV